MMLLGIVICTFVNVFLKNDTLDLFVSYRKNTESVGVKRFIDQLNKVFHLDKNLD